MALLILSYNSCHKAMTPVGFNYQTKQQDVPRTTVLQKQSIPETYQIWHLLQTLTVTVLLPIAASTVIIFYGIGT